MSSQHHLEPVLATPSPVVASGSTVLSFTSPNQLVQIEGLLPISTRAYVDLALFYQRVAAILTITDNLAVQLASVVQALGSALQANAALIVLLDSTGRRFPVSQWLAAPEESSGLASEASLFNQVSTTSIASVDLSPLSIVRFAAVNPTLTYTALPPSQVVNLWHSMQPLPSGLESGVVMEIATVFQGQVNGFVSLLRSPEVPWTPQDGEQLQRLLEAIVPVLAQIQLQRALQRQRDYQSVVNQLTQAIHQAVDLEQIIKQAITTTAQALQSRRAMLLRLKYRNPRDFGRPTAELPQMKINVACDWQVDTGLVEWSAPHQSSPSSSVEQSFWLSECPLCQQALRQSPSPLVLLNPESLSAAIADQTSPLRLGSEAATIVMVPLQSQGKVLGFFLLQDQSFHSWDLADLELVELVAAQVSTAILHTESLRQVQGLVEQRTAELRQSMGIQAKLYERSRQQVEQLRHLNRLKDEFLSTVSHELRTPLASMTLAIRMLKLIKLEDDRVDRYLSILEQQCAQETELVNDLLALQELESQQVILQSQPVDLLTLLQELGESFTQTWSSKGLAIQMELPQTPLILYSDQESLRRILQELLTNAGKYSDNDCQVMLTCQDDPDNDRVLICLKNWGKGILADELPHIFEKFRRCHAATQDVAQGTGLGLALVQSLVHHLGGSIDASSEPVEGSESWETCFSLTLPRSRITAKT